MPGVVRIAKGACKETLLHEAHADFNAQSTYNDGKRYAEIVEH